MPTKRIMRHVMRWLLAGVVFLLVVEVCVRIEDRVRWGAPLVGSYAYANLSIADSTGTPSRPNARFEKWRINSYGFRGPEIALEPRPGVVRVAALGASETFGLYESSGGEFPARMQAHLNDATGEFEVINSSAAGMSLPRMRESFRDWTMRFAVDVVVVYPSPAFYVDNRPPREERIVREPPAPTVTFRLFARLRSTVKAFIPLGLRTMATRLGLRQKAAGEEDDWVWDSVPEDRLDLFQRHLEELVDELERGGVAIVLATHANRFERPLVGAEVDNLVEWRRFYPRAGGEVLLEFDAAANDVIREIGATRHIPIVDLAALVPRSPEYFADFSHFTDAGSDRVGGLLAQAVVALGDDRAKSGGQ